LPDKLIIKTLMVSFILGNTPIIKIGNCGFPVENL